MPPAFRRTWTPPWESTWLMRFNASKWQVVQVTKKSNPFLAKYTIHGQVLETVNSAKYLGVQLDTKMSFNNHVDAITRKAKRTRAAFSQNLFHSSQTIKEAVYFTFIRPTVEFAVSAWDPSTQRNSRQVEQVHRSAARFVMGNYGRTSNVTSLLDPFGWTSLQERHQARLQMMCKTRYNLVDIPWSSYLTPLSTSTRGYSSRFTIPHTRISKYASSYFPRTIRDWNQLPVDPAAYPSLNAFKSALRDLTK